MKKGAVFTVLIAALLCCSAAFAETLDEFKKELARYQEDPYARAMELKQLSEQAAVQHEKLFKQLDVPIESLLEYETTLAGTVNYYLSTYYFERQDSTSDNTIIDPDTLNKLVEQKPPYTLMYYYEVINSAEACRSVIKKRTEYLNKYTNMDMACRKRREKLEKDFRVLSDKLNNETDNLLDTSWKLKFTKAQIEKCVAQESFCRIAKKSRLASINELKSKVATLEGLLKKIRLNIVSDNTDTQQINAGAKYIHKLIFDTLESLNAVYDNLSRTLSDPEKKISDFERFCCTSEQSLIDSEVLLLLNMNEYTSMLREMEREMQEVWIGKKPSKEQIDAEKKKLADFNEKLFKDRDYCLNVQLVKIDSVETNALSLFGSKSISISPEDAALRGKFIERLQQYKKRNIEYIEAIMRQISYNNSSIAELDILAAETGASGGNNRLANIAAKFAALWDFEVFHFDDYPATLGRVITALLVMCIGIFAAFSLSNAIDKRFIQRSTEFAHTTIVLAFFVKYFILIIFALITLSILRLPLTALTFAGGALAVAFGFGAQQIMADVICGISILLKKRLRVGDHIIINNQYGIVQEITLRDTIILHDGSKQLVIPNSRFFANEFINLTLSDNEVRTTLELPIAYGSNLDEVRRIAYSVLEKNSLVLKEPYYRVLCDTADSGVIKLHVQFFCNIINRAECETRTAVFEELLAAFRENGIKVPFPQCDVHLKTENQTSI